MTDRFELYRNGTKVYDSGIVVTPPPDPVLPPPVPTPPPPLSGVTRLPFPPWGQPVSAQTDLKFTAGVRYSYPIPIGSAGQLGLDFISGSFVGAIAVSKIEGEVESLRGSKYYSEIQTTTANIAWTPVPLVFGENRAVITKTEQWFVNVIVTSPASGVAHAQTSGA